jgi:hypothetical protein
MTERQMAAVAQRQAEQEKYILAGQLPDRGDLWWWDEAAA